MDEDDKAALQTFLNGNGLAALLERLVSNAITVPLLLGMKPSAIAALVPEESLREKTLEVLGEIRKYAATVDDDRADQESVFKGNRVETYETQRWFPLVGWGAKRLPTDVAEWCSEQRKPRQREKIALPPHSLWTTTWKLDTSSGDKDGWEYAGDWWWKYHAKPKAADCVRRRKWVREYQRTTDEAVEASTILNLEANSGPLGMTFDGSLVLREVEINSAADLSGGSCFLGHRLTAINGITVTGLPEVKEIFRGSEPGVKESVTLQFEPPAVRVPGQKSGEQNVLQRYFPGMLPPAERVVSDYPCSYAKGGLHRIGRLYITHSYICFYSKMCEQVVVPFVHVTRVAKKSGKLFDGVHVHAISDALIAGDAQGSGISAQPSSDMLAVDRDGCSTSTRNLHASSTKDLGDAESDGTGSELVGTTGPEDVHVFTAFIDQSIDAACELMQRLQMVKGRYSLGRSDDASTPLRPRSSSLNDPDTDPEPAAPNGAQPCAKPSSQTPVASPRTSGDFPRPGNSPTSPQAKLNSTWASIGSLRNSVTTRARKGSEARLSDKPASPLTPVVDRKAFHAAPPPAEAAEEDDLFVPSRASSPECSPPLPTPPAAGTPTDAAQPARPADKSSSGGSESDACANTFQRANDSFGEKQPTPPTTTAAAAAEGGGGEDPPVGAPDADDSCEQAGGLLSRDTVREGYFPVPEPAAVDQQAVPIDFGPGLYRVKVVTGKTVKCAVYAAADKGARVVDKLLPGTTVEVTASKGKMVKIKVPVTGWVKAGCLVPSPAHVNNREREDKVNELKKVIQGFPELNEQVVESYQCSFKAKNFIDRVGKLWLTNIRMIFTSPLMNDPLVVPHVDVVEITKKRDLLVLNAIVVRTVSETHTFTAFLMNRDTAFDLMKSLWSVRLGTENKTPESIRRDSQRRTSKTTPPGGVESLPSERQQQQQDAAAQTPVAPLPGVHSVADCVQLFSAHPSFEELHRETDFVGEGAKKGKKVVSDFPLTRGVSASTALLRLFGSDASFLEAYHQTRGEYLGTRQDPQKVIIPAWEPLAPADPGAHASAGYRTFECTTVIQAPWSKHTRLQEHHRFAYFHEDSETGTPRFIWHCASQIPDVMYGDYFRVESVVDVRETTPAACVASVYCVLHFYKDPTFLLKGKIESTAVGESTVSYKQLLQQANAWLLKDAAPPGPGVVPAEIAAVAAAGGAVSAPAVLAAVPGFSPGPPVPSPREAAPWGAAREGWVGVVVDGAWLGFTVAFAYILYTLYATVAAASVMLGQLSTVTALLHAASVCGEHAGCNQTDALAAFSRLVNATGGAAQALPLAYRLDTAAASQSAALSSLFSCLILALLALAGYFFVTRR
ncbi:Tectonin beta-propeller repeat-containing protein [Diplonema papillatum]|nr:Tectonin beta-propeller repeat-containing protein [Diplonema papillatum]KAJ9469572.1 Tectonin beta-propeller repeat-containing protein [Diplonema papillatum]KAJ9469573.1 Tectonin beta-propeller repeat-containing protein [Diplonema papillatum]